MSTTRTNSGKQTGLMVVQLGNWNLRQTAEGRYKVAAIDPVNGKANYSFGIKDGRLDTHVGLDCTKLAEERPELLKAVEAYFRDQSGPPIDLSKDDEDPYGDLAITRRKRLTPEQNWKRGLLQMRRVDFEHAAAKRESVLESAVRMLWAGVFGTKIDDATAAQALTWITHRKGNVDLKMLLQVEQDYYAGKFAPNASTILAERLDLLAGINEFENVEEEINGRETTTDERVDTDGPSWSESSNNADPFAAFR